MREAALSIAEGRLLLGGLQAEGLHTAAAACREFRNGVVLMAENYVVVRCAECSTELNRTNPMDIPLIREEWAQIALTAPLMTRACPNGCRPTCNDYNANTTMLIGDESGVERDPKEVLRG